jgi:trehalose/maltose hydrolase-like predicted phosphorylase
MAFCFEPLEVEKEYKAEFKAEDRIIRKRIQFYGKMGKEYVFDKFTAVFSSRDNAQEPLQEAREAAVKARSEGFDRLHKRNCDSWRSRWEVSDITIEGDDLSQQGIRYNIFQLIQACDHDNQFVSIGARGLTHSRYKGCYFWDADIFMLPFFLYTNPKAAESLVKYRYNTLEGARENARAQNLEGARYAWMCTSDGLEQCGTWDIGLSEVHVTADVAYAVNKYAEAAGGEDFMADFGAEILIETARYWKSRFTYDEESDSYNLLFVKGPNEYGGVTSNNTYTVFMAINNFKAAEHAVKLLESKYPHKLSLLKDKLCFNDKEIEAWKDISGKVNINYDAARKLYIEDDTFLKLEPCDIRNLKEGNRASYHKVCFDRLQRYRVLKQADVLLLMQLLPRLFSEEEKKAAWEMYEPITLHDSSLSYGTHASLAANLGLVDKAYDYFVKCVRYNLDDIMGNTGREGLHMASMGSAWYAVVMGFGGVTMEDGEIRIHPSPPRMEGSWLLTVL